MRRSYKLIQRGSGSVVQDCNGCSPDSTEDPALPLSAEFAIPGIEWGVPESSTGTIGPYDWYVPVCTGGQRVFECGSVVATPANCDCGPARIRGTMDWGFASRPLSFASSGTLHRVTPDSNKCVWSSTDSKVANVWFKEGVIGIRNDLLPRILEPVTPGDDVEFVDVGHVGDDPDFGAAYDTGEDNLAFHSIEEGATITRLSDRTRPRPAFTWSNCRRVFGTSISLYTVTINETKRWAMRVSASVVRYATGNWKRTGGTLTTPEALSFPLTGTYCWRGHGIQLPFEPGAGTLVFGCAESEQQLLYGDPNAHTNVSSTPSSSPPSGWLQGSGVPLSLTITYIADSRAKCRSELFRDDPSIITFTRSAETSESTYEAMESLWGATIPETAWARFIHVD